MLAKFYIKQLLIYSLRLILAITIMPAITLAQNKMCNATVENPCLVEDKITPGLPEHWRTSQMIGQACQQKNCADNGLQNLWMSGSAAPATINNWQAIYTAIENITHGKVKNIVAVDLRQENHGYLNDRGITLYTKNDWINAGKSHAEALLAEQNWLTQLSQQKFVTSVLTTKQVKTGNYQGGKTLPVDTVKTEQALVTANGFYYFRLTVTDHKAPENAEIDRFVNFVHQLPTDTWLHFHCHGGDGRTTTFMLMYDMLHNANQLSFQQLVARQAVVAPFYDVTVTQRKNALYTALYQQRLVFLKQFYAYSQAYLQGDQESWSSWFKRNQQ